MKGSKEFKDRYDSLKDEIINDIWSLILDSCGENENVKELELGETRNCPAIVTQIIDDQESEVIHALQVKDNRVIAIAGIYEYDNDYDISEFEVPMLITILDSVERHIK